MEPGLVESIFIELEIPGKHNIVLGSLYRIPNSSEKEFNQIYKTFINDWDINKELVIGIDQILISYNHMNIIKHKISWRLI